jgi:hypothetical protein
MKAFILSLAMAASAATGPAATAWDYGAFSPQAQAQRGPPGPPPGVERREPPRDMRRGERVDERPGRMTDDERRALHRDLDKANRELYRRRQK